MRQFALLLAMLTLFSPLLCAQDIGRASVGSNHHVPSDSAEGKKSRTSARNGASQDGFCRTAETKAAKAIAFRHKETSKDLAAAISLFQESGHILQACRLYAEVTGAYLQIGEIYFTLSKYDKALGSYRRALKVAGSDRDQRCRVLSHIARTYATKGQASEADTYSSQAMSLCEGLPDRKTLAEALEARGEALFNAGDSMKSAELFRRAQGLFAEVGDDQGQALALLMLAFARWRVAERAEGHRLAGQALALWDSRGDKDGVAQARTALGLFAVATGEFETARCNFGRAYGAFHEINDKDNEAIVLNGLGYVNRETGDAQASLEYYQLARAAFASVQDRLGAAEAINGMGMALTAMQRYEQLLPLYAEKYRFAKQANNPLLLASALADLAGVYELKHEYVKAEALYRRSLAAYVSAHHPLREAQVSIRFARMQGDRARYPQAIALLEHVLTLTEQTAQVEDIAKAQYELAYIYRRLGRPEDALQSIRKTIDIIESQRLKMAAFDSRASYFAAVHKYYALYIQLLMLQDRQNPELRSAAKAFEASEKSKVRSLLDWLAGPSQEASCDELLKRQLEIADTAPVTAVDAKAALSSETSPALTLPQVQAEIVGDDATMLEYALGDEKSYLWVITKEQLSSHELPAAKQLNELVQSFRNAVTAQQPRSQESNIQYLARLRKADRDYPRYTAELSRLLLGSVTLGPSKRVIIVPEGPLQYVPFAALSVRDESRRRAILASDHEVTILPSASALSAIRQAEARRPPPTAAAAVFADPVFELAPSVQGSGDRARERQARYRSVARSEWQRIHPGSRRIPRLPGSRQEAEAVLRNLGPEGVLLASGFLANRDTVLNHDLGRYRVIHFATHGILDGKRPERSGLILSLIKNRQGEPVNGYLTLSDIYGLKLSADLVVLSSCDSGLGKDLSSEGIIGLPRAFLRAGAKSVIATLWKVDDAATAELMTHFYVHLHQGERPASALRNAQLELSRYRQWSHPYYWAAFVLQGDYKVSGLN